MPTEKPRVMVTIHDPDIGPTLGAELNGASVAGALRRYAELVERGAAELEAVLSRAEWNAVADANNGCADLYDHFDGPSTSPLLMAWANVQDSEGLGAKWGIDAAELVRKLQSLAPHHGEAILCAVRWFWSRCETVNHKRDDWWKPKFRKSKE